MPRRRRGDRRQARRPLPAGRLPDRARGTQIEHERQRGHLEPRDRAGRRRAGLEEAGPPERRRQPRPVVERHVPDGDAHRRRRAARGRAAARRSTGCATRSRPRPRRSPTSSRSAARTCRTRRRSRSARRSAAGWRSSTSALGDVAPRDARGCASSRSAAPRSAPGSTRTRSSASARRAQYRARDRAAVPLGATNKFAALAAHDALVNALGAPADARRRADEDRERRPLAGVGPALRHRRDRDPGERAGLVDHAGQGQPDAVRGADDGLRPGVRQRRRGRRSAARRATSS